MKHYEENLNWVKEFYQSAVEWWGESWYDGENLQQRLDLVRRYGIGDSLLELAAGTGETACYFCENGYSVCAVDICSANIELLKKAKRRYEKLDVIEGDFLEVEINSKFNTICLFETFGIGSDREQRKLLERVSNDWLGEGGRLIFDVYHPYMPIKNNGTVRILDKLENVPGSVDMTEYSYYDSIKNRWIDIWEPKGHKEKTRIQSIRCYTPSDLKLLAEGSGLKINNVLFMGREIDIESKEIIHDSIFENEDRNYSYIVVMGKKY